MTDSRLRTALRSDKGQVRDNNEDSVAEDRGIGLIALADGMGGYNAGEVASGMAVQYVMNDVRQRWPALDRERVDPHSGRHGEALLLRDALVAANAAIFEAAGRNPAQAGMGTTALIALVGERRLSVAYVGDSRLYRLRAGKLQAITRDHSLVEELISRGHYSRDEAATLVRRNIVTRALGVEADVEIDVLEETMQPDDLLLLCSDGLTDMVDDDAIELTLNQFGEDLDAAAELLVRKANARGGHDNVTVALARIDTTQAATERGWWQRLTGKG